MVIFRPLVRMASTCAGHWSISVTSSPASIRLAAMQLPLAPVPRTAIFRDISVLYADSVLLQQLRQPNRDHGRPAFLADRFQAAPQCAFDLCRVRDVLAIGAGGLR